MWELISRKVGHNKGHEDHHHHTYQRGATLIRFKMVTNFIPISSKEILIHINIKRLELS
jgi:hypothetical protein